MRCHLEQQYPKAVEKLQMSLDDTLARLEVIKEKAPVQILYEMAEIISSNYRTKRELLMTDLRQTLDQMTQEIQNFALVPKDGDDFSFRDQFDEALE